MQKSIKRSGLKLYTEVTLTAKDTPEAWLAFMTAGTPAARLEAVTKRARPYMRIRNVALELEEIQNRMSDPASREVLNALLALERGLDLLDTQRYLEAIRRDEKTQAGRRRGAAIANAQRGALPSAADIRAEMEKLLEGKNRSERDARSIIRNKYGVSRSALSQKLNPKKR